MLLVQALAFALASNPLAANDASNFRDVPFGVLAESTPVPTPQPIGSDGPPPSYEPCPACGMG